MYFCAQPVHSVPLLKVTGLLSRSVFQSGASKKRAKHQASYLILLKMLNSRLLTESEKNTLRDIHIAAVNVLGSDFMDSLDDIELDGLPNKIKQEEEGNFVGQLQDLCQKNTWPPPSYEFLTIPQSTPSGNEYSCKVRLWKWTHTGKINIFVGILQDLETPKNLQSDAQP